MAGTVAPTAVVYPGVTLGEGVVVEDHCIIGCPPAGSAAPLATVIGEHSRIRSHTVIYAGTTIGAHFQSGNKANIREHCVIGARVSVGTLAVLEHHVRIEDGVRIHSQAFIPEYSVLKSESWVGPAAVLTNAAYPASPGAKAGLKGVVLEPRARVGANATILPGVVLGENCLVGAGSVVTRDVAPGDVVAGNPARPIRRITDLPYE
jgi:acetyltransferase-like isoleucine patch superfamily enzyme